MPKALCTGVLALLLLCPAMLPPPAGAVCGQAARLAKAAAAGTESELRRAILIRATDLCPQQSRYGQALAGFYLKMAAKEADPDRAQALLALAEAALRRALAAPDAPSKELELRLAALARRMDQLSARSENAILSAPHIAWHLGPRPGGERPALAPLALGRLSFCNLRFAVGSANFTPSSVKQLDELGRCLKYVLPRRRVLLAGHTDRQGEGPPSVELSLRRAQAVRDYLVKRWEIEPGRLSVMGLGHGRPLPGLSPYDPLNRRVEVRCLPGTGREK